MYIKKIVLRDVRCFEKVEIDLTSDEKDKRIKKWAMVLGDNGVGKTTLLRCIALGLCDQAGAVGLLIDTYGKWIRTGQKKATIKIELQDLDKTYSLLTEIVETPSGGETVWRARGVEEKIPWEKIFVCAYGANRRTEGSMTYDEYSAADAVYTLFNYDWPLQDPELVMRRRPRYVGSKICRWLEGILMLEKGAVVLTSTGLAVSGPWGSPIPLGALGDGYVATMLWITDMLGWAILVGQFLRGDWLSGVVLVDELEQHLHPKWQRHIVCLLRERFPNIQFIVATHSPLCVGGTADLPHEDYKIALLNRRDDGVVNLTESEHELAGWRADQILASELFGYIIESNENTEKLLREASILAGKGPKRTKRENNRYKKVKERLKSALLSDGTTLIERELMREEAGAVKKKTSKLEQKLFGERNDKH